MDDAPDVAAAGVTEREAEVLTLLGENLSHAEIAARLFISVRTVESHAKSLRHKLGLTDRRELIQVAARYRLSAAGATADRATPLRPSRLPEPLTSFIGRDIERNALATALDEARLVTAVGPAGVGKTRLALTVVGDIAERFGNGVHHVDLAAVTDPAMVAAAVSNAVGVSEVAGQSAEDALLAALGNTEALLLLDNAEHVVNSVAMLVERLLAAAPGLVVLVTSRVRLVVPFERVYHVPALSLPEDGSGDAGDAMTLFIARATTAGYPPPQADERPRIVTICDSLEGMALAIELAAARLPSLGLDGLERGLANPVGLLSGGARLHSRHRSLHDALEWSYELLEPVDRAVFRRVSTFAAPFTADAAAHVAGYGEVEAGQVTASLVRLVDSSLLATVAIPGDANTRYRALESVRQYGAEQINTTDDIEARSRHSGWCLDTANQLDDGVPSDPDAWRDALDLVVNDLRAALGWAAAEPSHRRRAHELAAKLAHLLFLRGRAGESQRRYEQAAELADDRSAASESFTRAAAMAKCRVLGEEALRLHRLAAEAARDGGDQRGAAIALARGAELIRRWAGMFVQLPPTGTAEAMIAEARRAARGDPRAEIAADVADLFADDDVAAVPERAAHAVEVARQLDDPLLESAAMDAAMAFELIHGDVVKAAAMSRRPVELLTPHASDPEVAIELKDALHVGAFTSVGAGDLPGARRAAEQQLRLPFLREEQYLAYEDLLPPDALAGHWDRVLALSGHYRDSWERAGRPCAPGRGMPACAIAMVHGLRGDDEARDDWLHVLAAFRGVDPSHATRGSGYGEVFDAIVHLHRGEAAEARVILSTEPPDKSVLYWPLFRQWSQALLAESSVLADVVHAETVIAAAEAAVIGNPIATGLVDRARALHRDDRQELLAAADRLDDADCPYQAERTRLLAGTS